MTQLDLVRSQVLDHVNVFLGDFLGLDGVALVCQFLDVGPRLVRPSF
jgi:hypothetical protein